MIFILRHIMQTCIKLSSAALIPQAHSLIALRRPPMLFASLSTFVLYR
jgi:hypothetical protein